MTTSLTIKLSNNELHQYRLILENPWRNALFSNIAQYDMLGAPYICRAIRQIPRTEPFKL